MSTWWAIVQVLLWGRTITWVVNKARAKWADAKARAAARAAES